MTEDERLHRLLCTALPPAAGQRPSRDLWPLVVKRTQERVRWSWLDLGLAAVVAILLLVFPQWLVLLVYHL